MLELSLPRTEIDAVWARWSSLDAVALPADPVEWSERERTEPPVVSAPLMQPMSRPRLMCFGDTHGSFDFVIQCVHKYRPEAIILLGDVQAQRPLHLELASVLALTEVWFIPGNHDTDSDDDYDNLFGSDLAHRNLHGRVVEIAGFKVAGLGGVFRESIWAPPLEPAYQSAAERLKITRRGERWRGGLSRRHRSTIFPDDYARLASQRADVLVTHEGLSGHPRGWKALDDLALAMRVEVVVHGHLHKTIDYIAEGRLDPGAGYQAFGVAPDHCLIWPRPTALLGGRSA